MAGEIVAVYSEHYSGGLDFGADEWVGAIRHPIDLDWRGRPAPVELATTARLLWNERELVIGYECDFTELDVDDIPDPEEERHALWDRDVCEAFIRSPLEPHPQSYREFEVAPTGQWCDLLVDRARMWHDWEWRSGMRTFSRIDADPTQRKVWRVAMAIPFSAFGCRPGEGWQANLFRISRLAAERQYLTYSPTLTVVPNFHVAEAFVELLFR